jgi:hypothetical protein
MRARQGLRLVIPAAVAAVALTACGGGGPHAVSPQRLNTAQAQALAIMRFHNYDKGVLDVRVDVPAGSVDFRADAVLDLRQGVAYGEYSTTLPHSSAKVSSGVIAWSRSLVETTDGGTFAQKPKATAWTERPIGQASAIDVMLLLALDLGDDRPENPALLQQSGARLLRTEHSGGKNIWVISGPGSAVADTGLPSPAAAGTQTQSRTTYWIDSTGALSRFEADLGGATARLSVEGTSGYPAAVPKRIFKYLRLKESK